MKTQKTTTLRDLVQTVSQFAKDDTEVVTVVAHMINSGRVQLARIIHEEVGRYGSTLLRSEAVNTFGPCAKERAEGRVYYTTLAGFPSDRTPDGGF